VAAAVADGTLRRVHRGVYVEKSVWDAQYTEGRHLLQVVAIDAQRLGSDAAYSHVSAGAIHELPLFRLTPTHVHTSGAGLDGHTNSGRPGIARHEIEVPEADRTTIDGIPCTTLARTVADIVRTVPLESGLSAADAALRKVAWDDSARAYDATAAQTLVAEVLAHAERHRRARGVRRARLVMGLADGRAQLPGESVSRLYLLDLGFRIPQLQVPIPSPQGGFYYVDFDLGDAWGEFDGKGKYLLQAEERGISLEQVMLEEKQREDWIRGTTQRRMPRWGSTDIKSAATLGSRLAAFHVHPPR